MRVFRRSFFRSLNRWVTHVGLAVLLVCQYGATTHGESQDTQEAFDVASIKEVTDLSTPQRLMGSPGGTFQMANMPVRQLIAWAYGMNADAIIGGPDWMHNTPFSVRAKAAGHPTTAQLRQMAQTLLRTRMNFRAHVDQRSSRVWVLERVKDDGRIEGGLVRRESPCDRGTPVVVVDATVRCGGFVGNAARLRAAGMSLNTFASLISGLLLAGTPVVDQTNLDGTYDVALDVEPDASATAINPLVPLFDAMRRQLGLKLTAKQESRDVLVVDGIQRPTPD